jgi:hypothetical protein
MAATLQLSREGVGIELRRGTFEVVLDGHDLRTIEWRETVEVTIEPGHHVLGLRKGRYSSGTHEFEAADGDLVRFRCHGAMIWPRFVASLAKPDWAIALIRE